MTEDLSAALDDVERIATARRLAQQAGKPALDRLTELAALLLGAGSAQISIIAEEQVVVGGTGGAAPSVGRSSAAADSLCTVTLRQGTTLPLDDAAADHRVSHLPPVASGAVGSYLGVPLRTAEGKAVGALCVFDDHPRSWSPWEMTTLERLAGPVMAELELAALSMDFEAGQLVWQLAVDAARIGTFDWDIATDVLEWDDRLLELFGIDRAEFGGSIAAFNAAVHPDDLPRVTRALQHAVDSCGEYAAEYRVLHPDGEVRWITARGRALPGPDGTAQRLLGAAFDTTAEQEAEARVSRALEAMPTAFYHLDREWRFRHVNSEAERLLGVTRDELIGLSVWERFPAARDSDFELHYREAVDTGEPVSFEAFYPEPLEGWYEIRAWPSPDGLSVYFIEVTDRHEAQQTLEREARRGSLMARLAQELTDSVDMDEVVSRLAGVLVPELGDWCLATLLEGTAPHDIRRSLRDVGWAHRDPELRPVLDRFAEVRLAEMTDLSFMPDVLASTAPMVSNEGALAALEAVTAPGEAVELARRLDPAAVAVVRLPGRSRDVGLLTVFRGSDRPGFGEEDVELLAELASRAGLALDNARLFAEQRALAEGLQRSMLSEPPQPDHLEIAVRYEPAAEAAQVGGDWYDAFLQPGGATTVVVGDVVGHDVAAAAAMGQVRALLRGIAVHSGDGPAAVLRGVDRAMDTLRVDTTATAIVARFEQTEEELAAGLTRVRWSSAGHPPAVLVTPEGEVEVLAGQAPDLLLGLDADTERAEHEVTVRRGSTLLLYTDGLVERRGESIDEGLERLGGVLREVVPHGGVLDGLCDALVARLAAAERREDDVALVAVRLHPQDGPPPTRD